MLEISFLALLILEIIAVFHLQLLQFLGKLVVVALKQILRLLQPRNFLVLFEKIFL